ncbi:hypothetical protein AB0H42_35495, partial [Nocardia sp. NPDC050799]|uniref:hypothetical protein n=1 Tax=Nocardia sp. NPDC050799 TaxID=3154842 RepID=UPI00340B4173
TPRGGVGYGVGAYLAGWPVPAKTSDVCLNYLGHFGTADREGTVFAHATEPLAPHTLAGRRHYLLEVDAAIENGRLAIWLRYDTTTHGEAEITSLADGTMAVLTALSSELGNSERE